MKIYVNEDLSETIVEEKIKVAEKLLKEQKELDLDVQELISENIKELLA